MNYDTETIQALLDQVTLEYIDNPAFISVEFTQEERIVVRFSRLDSLPKDARTNIVCSPVEGRPEATIEIAYEEGPEIVESLGEVDRDPPNEEFLATAGEMGGDQCRNANNMNYYGTISFYASSVSYDTSGLCNSNCSAAPALFSNNHVIARSDQASIGEVIWTPFNPDVARLSCFIPFRCNSSTDMALARVNDLTGISRFTVRTIGKMTGIRRPGIGEGIQKHGARTGYTTGTVSGQTNIKVGKYWFRRVFSTSGGFGCSGDSGSSVVGNDKNLLGIFSWGDDLPCSQNPRGYFWPFINPGTLSNAQTSSSATTQVDIS